jgi:ComF family protein
MRRLKLGGRPDLARPLAESLVPLLSGCRPDALVVPVPLHRRRLIERGFNQAALLSLVAARQTGHQVALRALDRSRETPSQATLSLPERHRSPRGAFVAVSRFVTAREVILVDDVLTTGATAAAATEALLRAGARDVRVLTVARAVP